MKSLVSFYFHMEVCIWTCPCWQTGVEANGRETQYNIMHIKVKTGKKVSSVSDCEVECITLCYSFPDQDSCRGSCHPPAASQRHGTLRWEHSTEGTGGASNDVYPPRQSQSDSFIASLYPTLSSIARLKVSLSFWWITNILKYFWWITNILKYFWWFAIFSWKATCIPGSAWWGMDGSWREIFWDDFHGLWRG